MILEFEVNQKKRCDYPNCRIKKTMSYDNNESYCKKHYELMFFVRALANELVRMRMRR